MGATDLTTLTIWKENTSSDWMGYTEKYLTREIVTFLIMVNAGKIVYDGMNSKYISVWQ